MVFLRDDTEIADQTGLLSLPLFACHRKRCASRGRHGGKRQPQGQVAVVAGAGRSAAGQLGIPIADGIGRELREALREARARTARHHFCLSVVHGEQREAARIPVRRVPEPCRDLDLQRNRLSAGIRDLPRFFVAGVYPEGDLHRDADLLPALFRQCLELPGIFP